MRTFSISFGYGIPPRWMEIIKLACRAWEKSDKVQFLDVPGYTPLRFERAYLREDQVAFREVRGDMQVIQISTRQTFSTATSWLGRLFATSGDFDLLSVIEHEIGHVLCGPSHTDENDSILKEDYKTLPSKPSARDFARL